MSTSYKQMIKKLSDCAQYIMQTIQPAIICLDKDGDEIWYIYRPFHHKWVNMPFSEICKFVFVYQVLQYMAQNEIAHDTNTKLKIVRNICLTNGTDFLEKLDMNPDLIAFNNGVYDIKSHHFRPGNPGDYISRTVGYDYLNDNNVTHVNTLIAMLPDNTNMRKYFLNYLEKKVDTPKLDNVSELTHCSSKSNDDIPGVELAVDPKIYLNNIYGAHGNILKSKSCSSSDDDIPGLELAVDSKIYLNTIYGAHGNALKSKPCSSSDDKIVKLEATYDEDTMTSKNCDTSRSKSRSSSDDIPGLETVSNPEPTHKMCINESNNLINAYSVPIISQIYKPNAQKFIDLHYVFDKSKAHDLPKLVDAHGKIVWQNDAELAVMMFDETESIVDIKRIFVNRFQTIFAYDGKNDIDIKFNNGIYVEIPVNKEDMHKIRCHMLTKHGVCIIIIDMQKFCDIYA